MKYLTQAIYHAASQKAASKPVIIEEFGVADNKVIYFTKALNACVIDQITYKQASSALSFGNAHDDGHAVFPGEAEYTLLTKYSAKIKARG
ncbi:hypothetical protein RhiJN_22050 [Ceratobasidium sp. AG-Ba]|nr:hypothetical protein RhiJN_22050 [Ceratobasidium sp. AG-Ba]